MALPQNPNYLLSTQQASEFFGGSPATATLHIWRGQGRGPRYCKLGGKVRYRLADLERWLQERVIDPAQRG